MILVLAFLRQLHSPRDNLPGEIHEAPQTELLPLFTLPEQSERKVTPGVLPTPSESRWPWKGLAGSAPSRSALQPSTRRPSPGSPGSGVVSRLSLARACGPWTGCRRTPHRSLRFHPQADLGRLNTAIQAGEERSERRNLGSE